MICISCGNSSFLLYSQNSSMGIPVYQCKFCKLYFNGNSENQVKMRSQEIYSENYWNERKSEESLKSDYSDKASQYKRKHWLSQREYCKSYLEGKKDILEIGSGAGQTLTYFEEIGFNVTGIEPDSRNVERINQKLKRGHCISGFVEEMTIDGMFDVIWISHVFEHLIRPDLLLKKCKNNLRKNGFIFIEVPECENPKILKESIFDNPSSFHFTKKTLSNIVQNAGYKIVRCDSLRVPNLAEAGIMKVMRKKLKSIGYNPYPYYPRIITNKNNGQMIRMIITN